MKKQHIIGLLIALGFLAVGLTLWVRSPPTPQATIRIGAILPLTGPGSAFANYIKDGIEFAKDDLAKQGISLEIRYEDSKTQPKAGIDAYRNLTADKDIKSVVVALSSVAKAIASLTDENVVQVYTAVAIPGVADGKTRFRLYPDAQGMAGTMANYIIRHSSHRNAGVICINDDFGRVSLEAFKSVLEASGGTVQASESYEPSATEVKSQIDKIANAIPSIDAVYVCGYGPAYGNVVRQMKESNLKADIYADMTLGLPTTLKQIGDAAEGVHFVDGQMDREFADRFKRERQTEPTSYAGYAYDAITALASVQKQSQDAQSIGAQLRALRDVNGSMGTWSFSETGESGLKFGVFKIESGQRIAITH